MAEEKAQLISWRCGQQRTHGLLQLSSACLRWPTAEVHCDDRRTTMNGPALDGTMMWGMGSGGLLMLLLVALAIAALAKYLSFGGRS